MGVKKLIVKIYPVHKLALGGRGVSLVYEIQEVGGAGADIFTIGSVGSSEVPEPCGCIVENFRKSVEFPGCPLDSV